MSRQEIGMVNLDDYVSAAPLPSNWEGERTTYGYTWRCPYCEAASSEWVSATERGGRPSVERYQERHVLGHIAAAVLGPDGSAGGEV